MPVKIKKIPQPAPPVYMPPQINQQTYVPPTGIIQPNYMPPPGMSQPTYAVPTPVYNTSDKDNIITHTEYELLIDENRPELVMLKSPEKDKLLEQINANVFDQMQKIIDDINAGYDYVKKTKILLAKLEHFPYLRKYASKN